MAQNITLSKTQYEKLIARIERLEQLVRSLFVEPSHGSDVWWKKEIEEAQKEFDQGKGTHFDSVEDAIQWLNS